MNDYFKVLSEYQNLCKVNQLNLDNLVNISIEIQTIKNGLKLLNSNLSTNNQNNFLLSPFSTMNNAFQVFSKNFNNIITSLEDEIIFPIETLSQNNEIISKENLNSFNQMANILIENKQHLNKTIDNYKQALKVSNIKNNSEDDVMKKQAAIENSKQLYKYGIEKMNRIIEESNKKYNEINKGIEANDESRNAIIKELLNKYSKICYKVADIFTEYAKTIKEEVVEKIDPKFRIIVFNPQKENEDRFKKEEYIDNFQIDDNDKNKDKNNNLFTDEFELISDNDININKGKTKQQIKEENNNKISNFISILFGNSEMPLDKISQIIQFINDFNGNDSQNTNSYLFLSEYLKKSKKFEFPNLANLNHFSNILNTLSINVNTKKDNYNNFLINDLIIQVCEKTSHKDTYLYSLLGKKNKFYATKTFWSQLISNKFLYSLNSHVKKLIVDKELKGNSKGGGKIYLLEFLEFSKKIEGYNKLNEVKKVSLENYARNVIDELIKDNIYHMANFKVPRNVGLDVINEYCRKFGINPEKKEYYTALLLTELSKNYNYKVKKSILKSTKIGQLILLKNSSLFLSNADILNLFLVNKSITVSLKKKVFKRILNDNARTISLNKRMEIWGILLNLKSVQEKYSYKDFYDKLEKKLIPNSKNNEIIELDVVRTFFEDNIEENQNKIKNILMILNNLFPHIGYCQGMNYIAAFLLQVFDYNEEKTFYYMAGILSNTDFGKLLENDLRLLKIFFFVVEKIIQVFIPKAYKVIIKNSILTNYFCPPWFLTLWTNVCPVFNKENTPLSSMVIIENFFVDGWISAIRAGYTVLKYYENDICNFPKEDIMHFIINQLPNKDLLKNEYFETFRKKYNESREVIKKELISNITKIYCYEEKNNNIS